MHQSKQHAYQAQCSAYQSGRLSYKSPQVSHVSQEPKEPSHPSQKLSYKTRQPSNQAYMSEDHDNSSHLTHTRGYQYHLPRNEPHGYVIRSTQKKTENPDDASLQSHQTHSNMKHRHSQTEDSFCEQKIFDKAETPQSFDSGIEIPVEKIQKQIPTSRRTSLTIGHVRTNSVISEKNGGETCGSSVNQRRNSSLTPGDNGRSVLSGSSNSDERNRHLSVNDNERNSENARKNSDTWQFPSVNFAYYHSRLSVLNADSVAPKYKSRRNSYDLIKDKCLAILKGDKKRGRSMDDEAYQVSKIITIFDNVGQKIGDRRNSLKVGGERQRKDEDRADEDGNDDGKGRKDAVDKDDESKEKKCSGRSGGKERNEKDTSKRVFKRQDKSDRNETTSTERGSRKVGTPKASRKTNTSEHQVSRKSHSDRVNRNIHHSRQMKEMERKISDRKVKDVSSEESSNHEDMEKQDVTEKNKYGFLKNSKRGDKNYNTGNSKNVDIKKKTISSKVTTEINTKPHVKSCHLQKHTLKTQATIEHVETNPTVSKNTRRSLLPTKVGQTKVEDVDQKRNIHIPHKNFSSGQTLVKNSPLEDSPLKSNEKIVKLLDSSHFVITKESDKTGKIHEGTKVVNLELDNINVEDNMRKVEIVDGRSASGLKDLQSEIDYQSLIAEMNLEKTVVSEESSTKYVAFGTPKVLDSIDDIRADGTFVTQNPMGQNIRYERIDEEIDVENKEALAIDSRADAFHRENVRDNLPESIKASESPHKSNVMIPTSNETLTTGVEMNPTPFEIRGRGSSSGIQELLASDLLKQMTNIERCQQHPKELPHQKEKLHQHSEQDCLNQKHQTPPKHSSDELVHQQYNQGQHNQLKHSPQQKKDTEYILHHYHQEDYQKHLTEQHQKQSSDQQQYKDLPNQEQNTEHQKQYNDQHQTQLTVQHQTHPTAQHPTQLTVQHQTQYNDQHQTHPTTQHPTQHIDQHQKPYTEHQQQLADLPQRLYSHHRQPSHDRVHPYQSSKGIRPSSVSTIGKLSKSSIQEDMLEIWLDHQKFLQRHPEDDSFYSFLFVFFAVFASFVFVLIMYFVMFVV